MAEPENVVLPDDVLLAILANLSTRELFSCRLVSRRFRDLCLHPDLWKSAFLSARAGGTLRAALRLAPCCDTLFLDSHDDFESVAYEVASTECVVAKVDIFTFHQENVGFAMDIIQKLSSLGGLREVGFSAAHVDFPSSFLEMLYNIVGLDKLTLGYNKSPLSGTQLSWRRVKPSLTHLSFEHNADPLLDLLLETHAPTLERVDLSAGRLPACFVNSGAPRLRTLTCGLHSELTYSQALSNLQTLTLMCFAEYPFPPSTLDFLRQSSHLRSVTFVFCYPTPSPTDPVLALAESDSAAGIKTLKLWFASLSLERMAAVLHLFPSLQSLSLKSPSMYPDPSKDARPTDSFLRAVSPASVPCLTSLEMEPARGCPHAWLHSPAVQDLLARNPCLHLRLDCKELPNCQCPWCRWGCHAELKTSLGRSRAFASHLKRAGCPEDCVSWPTCLTCYTPSA